MSRAFIDTTVLADALLKPGEAGVRAKRALSRYDATELPVYAIKEFKAGPLANFVWFHNKLKLTKSFHKALTALQRTSLSPRRYRTATALEALQGAAYTSRNLDATQLLEKYGDEARLDRMLADRFRLTIKRRIVRAWNRRRKVTSEVVIPLSCYIESPPYEENGLLKLEPTNCDPMTECCLAPALKSRGNDLRRLKAAIERQPVKRENQRRARVLRELYRTPKRLMNDRMCRAIGDAFFALFAPSDGVILTTNASDLEPLARALGKTVEEP